VASGRRTMIVDSLSGIGPRPKSEIACVERRLTIEATIQI
jgi:hypothetical protein